MRVVRVPRPSLSLFVAVLLTGACCGGSGAGGSGVEVTPPPTATNTPPPPAAGPTGEDAEWLRANASKGVGHCASDEIVLFDCGVRGDKRLSLCGSSTLDEVQYRFGPEGAPELVYPEDGTPSALTYGHQAWARGEEHSVSFARGDTSYAIVDAAGGGGPDGEANNYQGVKVYQGGEEIAFLPCTTIYDSQLDRLEAILK